MRAGTRARSWTTTVTILAAAVGASLVAVWTGLAGGGTPQAAAAEPIVVVTNGFEDGTTQGWAGRASEAVAVSTAVAHAGTSSLVVTGRAESWQGPSKNLLGTVEPGVRYTFSIWVRLAEGAANTQLRMSLERRFEGAASYDQIVGSTNVTSGAWTQLTGTYTLANDADFVSVYVESASGTGSFHVDDFSLSYVPATPIQTDIPSLKTVLANDFAIGAAVSRPQLLGEHAKLLTKHFNSVTAGNAMKWDATEPTEGTYRWTDADAIVAFANANGMQVRGHTLVWHNQTPAWVFQDAAGGTATKEVLLARLDAHIRAVAGRYANDIEYWDVVNEVIDENEADGLRRSSWFTIAGLDYIRTAFRVAREVAPNAKLYINDYNTNVPGKRDKLYNLVSQLKGEGVPIDGVGHQVHVNIDWPSVSETEQMITKFIPLGVDQQVTEMDMSIYNNNTESLPAVPQDRLIKQGTRYRDLFDVFRRYQAHISSVTVWGLADDDTWLSTFPITRLDAPLLFDTQLQAKPAYWGIVDPTRISASPTVSATASPTVSPTVSVTPSRTTPSTTPSGPNYPTDYPPSSSSAPPIGYCRIAYSIPSQWPGGFQGEVKITNIGTAPINGWTLRWGFANGQRVNHMWGGTPTHDDVWVDVTSVSWTASIAPGATVSIGFIGSWTGFNSTPTNFTLNGYPCIPAR